MNDNLSKDKNFLEPEIVNEFIELLEKKNTKKLKKKIQNFHSSEIAAYLQILNDLNRSRLLKILKKKF